MMPIIFVNAIIECVCRHLFYVNDRLRQRVCHFLAVILFTFSGPCLAEQVVASDDGEQRLMFDAYRLYTGTGTQNNYPAALALYRRAALLGNPEAQFVLGGMYYRGLGTAVDQREACKWLLRAAEQGKSTPLSIAIIGASYLRGKGVPQNYREALRWYKLAAEQGNRQARNELGYIYYNGLGVDQDFGKAAAWYREAALQGDNQSQYNLGLMYLQGAGLEQSRVLAYAWYSIAAGNGNSGAATARNALLPLMSWDEINRAQAQSMTLYQEIERRMDAKARLSEEIVPSPRR